MAKKIMSVVLVLVMLFVCALPAMALTTSEAKSTVNTLLWARDDSTTYAFEETEDYIAVTVVNHGVTFVFHVKSMIETPKLVSFSVDSESSSSLLLIALFNAIILKIATMFV